MAMAMAACNTRQRLSEVNRDGINYFMEKVLFQIYEHFEEQYLIDVTFKLSNPTALVPAHRLILSAASPYFKELFKNDQGLCPVIEITDIDSDAFERLITFCYTGQALITIDNVDSMLKTALTLQLSDAVANCIDFIMEHISDYTLERAYALQSETQCALLNDKIAEYEAGNFMSIIQSSEFLNFNASKLLAILKSDDLNVSSEKDAFKAVKRWYDHDASARKEKLSDLIACLRLTQFDTNFLLSNIQPLPGCHLLAMETLTWISHPLARSATSLKYTKRRKEGNIISQESFLAFQMKAEHSYYLKPLQDKAPYSIFQYNIIEDLWQKYFDIEIDVQDFRVIFMDDNLIFIGGNRNGKAINEVSSWDFKTKTFKRWHSMSQSRHRHSVVILNDKIYAIGGDGPDGSVSRSVEMYSISNGWESITSMIKPRCDASAVSLNGKIYVVGGWDGDRSRSVEYYDPTTKCWTQCADMNEIHYNYPGATVHNGKIFVAGGGNGSKPSGTVERYDPQTNEWTKICSLSIGLRSVGCISIGNQLWAVGGSDGDVKDFVSVYDEQNNKWILKKPLPLRGCYYCFHVPKALLQSE